MTSGRPEALISPVERRSNSYSVNRNKDKSSLKGAEVRGSSSAYGSRRTSTEKPRKSKIKLRKLYIA